MAMEYATVTGRIVIPGTTTGIPGELRATPLTEGGVLTFPSEDYTTIGYARADVTSDGTLDPDLQIPTDVPEGTHWRLSFVPKGKGNLPIRLGEYVITEDTDLADLVPVNILTMSPSLAEQILATIEAINAGGGVHVSWDDPTAAQIASAQGYWIVVSEDEPDETEMYGVPVLWLDSNENLAPTPVSPDVPDWDNLTAELDVPEVEGVIYKWVSGTGLPAGTVLVPGATVPTFGTFPRTVVIEALSAPGFTIFGQDTFTHVFADPSTSTLLTSDGFSGSSASDISGRATDVALGGSPVTWGGATDAWTINGSGKLASWASDGWKTATLDFTDCFGIRMEFDIDSFSGTQPLGSQVGFLFSITNLSGGNGWLSGSMTNSQITVAGKGPSGEDSYTTGSGDTLVPGTTGTWSISLVGTSASIIDPLGNERVYDFSTDDFADFYGTVKQVGIGIGRNGSSFAVVIDNFKVTKLGA